jgi:hypothetical protein
MAQTGGGWEKASLPWERLPSAEGGPHEEWDGKSIGKATALQSKCGNGRDARQFFEVFHGQFISGFWVFVVKVRAVFRIY